MIFSILISLRISLGKIEKEQYVFSIPILFYIFKFINFNKYIVGKQL